MSVDAMTAESIPKEKHHIAFFRQSGWLMFANLAGGVLMWAVHFLSKKIPEAEYGVFGAMLAVIMIVPSMPLQMVFAQQTAQALATQGERRLSGMIRLVWLGTTFFWIIGAVCALVFQSAILARWQISNPAVLWMTLPVLLFSLWLPMFWGLLQGRQSFLWMGWSMILNAAGRFFLAAAMVFFLVGTAVGLLAGVLAGLATAIGIAVWQTRELWAIKAEKFDWLGLLRRVLPLMIGFGAFQFLFTADTMFVKASFTPEDAAFYVSAGTLSRALLWLVVPLAAVMFPKIVHSAAKSEKSNLLKVVLLGTAVLAAGGAVGLNILGPFVVKLVFKNTYVVVATALLPWYAWAMVPLALANVLLNNLLARSQFGVVPVLVLLAVGYGFALTHFNSSLIEVLKTMGVFNVLLLLCTAFFTWRNPQPAAPDLPAVS